MNKKKQVKEINPGYRSLWYVLFLLVFLGLFGLGFHYYRNFFMPNITTGTQSSSFIYIHTGSDFKAVENLLTSHHFVQDLNSFEWVAQKKKYTEKVRPGRYKLVEGMSNNDLVNLLRSGIQEPVRLILLQNAKNPEELAGKIAAQIEGDSVSLVNLMHNYSYLGEFGVTPATVFTLMIPNTYEFLWNTNADQFIRRMYKERQKFWNDERLTKMSEEALDIPGVIILASILEKETNRNSEKPIIAGVYLNRLRKGWPLQADPTLIYAWNDPSIKRVLNKHKEIDSPYNTYKNTGLPPGPICLPSVSSIDAVLNYEHSAYMYFCARDDHSGYHSFAVTLAEHNRNAQRYQATLKR
jgi:UPF0755 protein